MNKQKEFVPQITDVEILNYPVKAGSGNIGIKANVLGEKRLTTIGLNEEHAWRKASEAEKPIIAMGIAARTFRFELREKLGYKPGAVQSPSQLMYYVWNQNGREVTGEEHEYTIDDKKLFPGDAETEIAFEVFDGFAVGQLEDKEYVMFYPTLQEVMFSEGMQNRIESYVGQPVRDTGICPADVAITYGKIELVQPVNRQQQVKEGLNDNPVEVKGIFNNSHYSPEILQAVLKAEGYSMDTTLPLDKDGKVQNGILLVSDDNRITGFLYGTGEHKDVFDEKNLINQGGTIDMFQNWKADICSTRISDIRIWQHPMDVNKQFISCKVDGEQQLSKELKRSDAGVWREMMRDLKGDPDNAKYADYVKSVSQTFAVNYFKDAILNERSLSQGLKR